MSGEGRLRLDDQLCFALFAATRSVLQAYAPLLREIGLTYPQYVVMLALWQDGPSAVDRLAERTGLGPAEMGPILDALERADFVIRLRGAGDRGAVRVAPTRAGDELESVAAKAQARVCARTELDPESYADLRDRLKALARATRF